MRVEDLRVERLAAEHAASTRSRRPRTASGSGCGTGAGGSRRPRRRASGAVRTARVSPAAPYWMSIRPCSSAWVVMPTLGCGAERVYAVLRRGRVVGARGRRVGLVLPVLGVRAVGTALAGEGLDRAARPAAGGGCRSGFAPAGCSRPSWPPRAVGARLAASAATTARTTRRTDEHGDRDERERAATDPLQARAVGVASRLLCSASRASRSCRRRSFSSWRLDMRRRRVAADPLEHLERLAAPPGGTVMRSCERTTRRSTIGCDAIEGQVRGLQRMVEDDAYCIDILTQVAAVRTALEQVALRVLDGHVRGLRRRCGRQHGGDGRRGEARRADGRRRALRQGALSRRRLWRSRPPPAAASASHAADASTRPGSRRSRRSGARARGAARATSRLPAGARSASRRRASRRRRTDGSGRGGGR